MMARLAMLLVVAAALAFFLIKTETADAPAPAPTATTTGTSTSTSTEILPTAKPQIKPEKTHTVTTTLFWVGELSNEENAYIPNDDSFWDDSWVEHYGGVDDPDDRCGYLPCAFTPKENPFYFALPYGVEGTAEYKNIWIRVTYHGKTCYGQWEDVGPFETNDSEYVFGDAEPKNTVNAHAGLDVSPALWTCLGLTDNDQTTWAFVEYREVPDGPWRKTVTTRGASWQ